MHSRREPRIMREPEGVVPNSLALAYVVTAQIGGLFLLTAHSMVIAAYLVHECAHMTLFRARTLNRWVGELMAWIAGAATSAPPPSKAAINDRSTGACMFDISVSSMNR